MPMDASWPLQQAVYARLAATPPLAALVGGIYDYAPESAALPYVTLGAATTRAWSTKTFSGQEHRFDVHAWSNEAGHGEAKRIMAAIYEALHDATLDIQGHRLVSLRFDFAQVLREATGPLHHAVIRFRALTHPIV